MCQPARQQRLQALQRLIAIGQQCIEPGMLCHQGRETGNAQPLYPVEIATGCRKTARIVKGLGKTPLRLTWDGIAIHGSPVMNGYASHGCIGVPNDFGRKLYAVTKLGDEVIITRGKRIGKGDSII